MKTSPQVRLAPSLGARVDAYQGISYALPYIAVYMLLVPMNIIQGIYAKYYGLALTTLATIILLSRIFDAVTDPIIGYLSDRYRAKHGTRKPFMIAGSLMILLCGYFLYIPPADVTAIYAGFWMIAFYMAFTIFEIPHITWPSDIANNSGDKIKLYSFKTFGSYAGLTLFYCIPFLPLFESSAITPETLKVTFIIVAVFALPFLYLAMRVVPNGHPPLIDKTEPSSKCSLASIKRELQPIAKNKPFLLFVLAFVFGGFASGMWYGLIFIYVDSYLDRGDLFAQLFLIAFFIGLLMTPVWYQLALRIGKKFAWMLSVGLLCSSFIFTGFLEPESTTFAQLLTLKVLQTSGFVCLNIVTPAMLSDIIDYSYWKTGVEKSATYFSIKVFFDKANVAAGMALGLAIAGWWGFDPGAVAHSEASIEGLMMAMVWLPTLLGLISLIFIALGPISERRHKAIRRRLDARLARAEQASSKPDNETLTLEPTKIASA